MTEASPRDAIANGKQVTLHYSLFVEGKCVDSSDDSGPLEYSHGSRQIIPGLEKKLEGLKKGDEIEVIVGPEDGYGIVDPRAIIEVSKNQMPEGDVHVGQSLVATMPDGTKLSAHIREIRLETIVLDFNHPLAGKELDFKIFIAEVK